jgi:uncharacterized caspase-like protein
MRQMMIVLRFIASFLVALGVSLQASAEKRAALVIGNGAYKAHGILDNPPNDARLVAKALANASFEVIDTQLNLGNGEMRQALRRFQSQADGAEVAIITESKRAA